MSHQVALQLVVLAHLDGDPVHALVVAGVGGDRHAPGVDRPGLAFVQGGQSPANQFFFVEDRHEGDHVGVVDAAEGGLVDEVDVAVPDPTGGVVQVGLQHVLDGDLALPPSAGRC